MGGSDRLIFTRLGGLEDVWLDGFFWDRSFSRHEGLEMSVDLRSAVQCDCVRLRIPQHLAALLFECEALPQSCP